MDIYVLFFIHLKHTLGKILAFNMDLWKNGYHIIPRPLLGSRPTPRSMQTHPLEGRGGPIPLYIPTLYSFEYAEGHWSPPGVEPQPEYVSTL